MRTPLILAVAAALCGSVADAQTPASPRPARSMSTVAQLDQRIPEINFQEVPFEQVMEFLANLTNMNVVVRWEILEAQSILRDKPITIKVKNLRLSQVLWLVMSEAAGTDVKLAYRASGNLLVLSTADDLGKEMIVRTYDIQDLTSRARNFFGPQIDVTQQQQGGGGQGGGSQQIFTGGQQQQQQQQQQQGGGETPQQLADIDKLIKLITDTIEPDSWQVNGGRGTINVFHGQLVVRNTVLVHQSIGGPVRDAD